MIASFTPFNLHGSIDAPPSKSMAHRYLIGASLSGKACTLSCIDYNEDILASIDCLTALGACVTKNKDTVTIDAQNFMQCKNPVLNCRESGSTLRFFIPIALCLGQNVVFNGSDRLLERPLDVYEILCSEHGFLFDKKNNSITICGNLKSGRFKIRGDISSQFITGLIFALVYLNEESVIDIIPPFESKSYVDLTISSLKSFGADVSFMGEYQIKITPSEMISFSGKIEGDYSNAAFLEAFNFIGSDIVVNNLSPDSLQGDKVYREYFDKIQSGTPTLDISNCPDLGPVLFALASLKNGAVFTGTDRLKIKESDRGAAMDCELKKLGGGLLFGNNSITVPKQSLQYNDTPIDAHNDHRIVMAMSIILSKIGGQINGVEAVKKSYPLFFEDIKSIGGKVDLS